ncbi:MAG: metal ABC transporter solute-binding protein, Zn/Mn family [Egibacteraceae bacterium]
MERRTGRQRGCRYRLAALLLAVLAAACQPALALPEDDRPTVLTTISILADFGRAVAGEHLRVESLVEIGGDPHTFEPRPSDAARITEADLIVRNGLGLEHWLDQLIDDASAQRPVATLTDGLTAARNGAAPDPHLWMDPELASEYVDRIAEAFSELDPAHAAAYHRNAAAYQRRLARLDAEMAALLDDVPAQRRRLVTTHDAFRYFGERYGLKIVGTIWSVSTEREPSAREISRLVDGIRAVDVPVVFVETTINPDLMRRVAHDGGVGVGEPLYGDSVGEIGSGAESYEGMMRTNARRIQRGLLTRSGS